MRVEGLAETTEITVDTVESQSSTWGFLREGSQESSGQVNIVNTSPGGASMGGRRWEECSARVEQVTGVCVQPKSSMQPSGVLLHHHHFSQVAQELHTAS